MYVCLCKAITDQQINQALANGAENLRDLQRCLDLGRQCGKCCHHARQMIQSSAQKPLR